MLIDLNPSKSKPVTCTTNVAVYECNNSFYIFCYVQEKQTRELEIAA